jgi:hypothetical protein
MVLAIPARAPEPTSGVAGSGGEMLVSCGAAVFAALYTAAGSGGNQEPDQDQPGPAGIAAGAAAVRRGPVQSGHGPPAHGRIARALITAACDPGKTEYVTRR